MKMRMCLAITAGAFLAAAAASTASAQVVISQSFPAGGNGGAPFNADFVELFNRGTIAVNIGGYSVQYANGTATTWNKVDVPANTIINPGKYYLIQMSSTGTNGVALPTPDLTASPFIGMNGGNGKVALRNNTTQIPNGTLCVVGQINTVDFIGYGPSSGVNAVTCFEGAAPAASTSNTTSAQRSLNGCTDTDSNINDLVLTTPIPRNSGTAAFSCLSGPAATDVAMGVATSPATVLGFPGNFTVSFTPVANLTGTATTGASGVTVTGTMPVGVSFVSSTIPGTTVLGQAVTIPLGNIAGNGTSAAFSVVLNSSQRFPVEAPAFVTWTVNYGGDTVLTNNSSTSRSEIIAPSEVVSTPVQQNDVVWGWSNPFNDNTLKLVRSAINATPALIRNNWRQFNFVQSAEFDNTGGIANNAAGNLLALNFGAAASGGLVYSYSTSDVSTATGALAGSFTGAFEFTSGTAVSFISRARLNGLSVSPDNLHVAMTGDNGSLYVFDYDAAPSDSVTFLSNGREISAINAASASVGTVWLDNRTIFIPSPGAGTDLFIRTVDLDTTAAAPGGLSEVGVASAVTAPGGGNMFTAPAYIPGLSSTLVIGVGRFSASVTNNTVFVYDTSVSGWQSAAPAGTFDYSTSVQTMREIGFASNGDLIIAQFGGSTTTPVANTPVLDRIAGATSLAAFANNNSTDIIGVTNIQPTAGQSSVSFPGLAVAASIGGSAACNPADIAGSGATYDPNTGTVDIGADGALTIEDFLIFLSAFGDGTGCPGTPPCNPADIAGSGATYDPNTGTVDIGADGQLTIEDFLIFLSAFGDGTNCQ